ncbi:MAG: hypothetical protein ATN31_00120 [Candidatus Epulonipiscioides saccharophilum]|nr:MAG: hypothetical protein ATN31_00120 [Epulopiscium sp. AS2M-Bin001]
MSKRLLKSLALSLSLAASSMSLQAADNIKDKISNINENSSTIDHDYSTESTQIPEVSEIMKTPITNIEMFKTSGLINIPQGLVLNITIPDPDIIIPDIPAVQLPDTLPIDIPQTPSTEIIQNPGSEIPNTPGAEILDTPGADIPKIVEPEISEPETREPEIIDPNVEDPDTIKPQKPEILSPDSENPQTLTPDSENPYTLTPDSENPQTLTPDSEIPNIEIPDSEIPQTLTPDSDNPDTLTPDSDNPNTLTPDFESPVTTIPEIVDKLNADSERSVTNVPGILDKLNADSERSVTNVPGILNKLNADSESPVTNVPGILNKLNTNTENEVPFKGTSNNEIPQYALPLPELPFIPTIYDLIFMAGASRSLLPLPQEIGTADLSTMFFDKHKYVSIEDIITLAGLTLSPSNIIALESVVSYDAFNERYEDDIYKIIEKDSLLKEVEKLTDQNLSQNFELELIIGSRDQLDYENKRYIISVNTLNLKDLFTPALNNLDDPNNITAINAVELDLGQSSKYTLKVPKEYSTVEKFGLGLTLNEKFANENYSATFYKGTLSANEIFDAVMANPAINITSDIKNSLYDIKDSQALTILLEKEGGFRAVINPIIEIVKTEDRAFDDVAYSLLYSQNNNGRVLASKSYKSEVINGIETITYTLENEFSTADDFYIGFSFFDAAIADFNKDKVESIQVVNSFDSAEILADVSSTALIGSGDDMWKEDSGFLFNGSGINFLVTTKAGREYKLAIKVDGTQPNFASDFRINGILGLSDLFIMPDDVDSMSKEYQTIFVNDTSFDLAKVKLKFLSNQASTVSTSDGSAVSGVTESNFSSGPVQYSVQNGSTTLNYWVDIRKIADGPKLFVNGVKNNVATRNITLAGDEGHDIFIANIGDEQLTELKVELSSDSKNVTLDDYWTIKENNSLNPLTSVAKDEIDSIAKVRLIADGFGEISGKLTISAKGQTPQVITLTGQAQNLAITTTEIKDGFKAIPYSHLIQTNNTSANVQTEFSIIDGEKPSWMTLNKSTGLLSGTPTSSGEYSFMVKVAFKSGTETLPAAYEKFTFKVSNELVNPDGEESDVFITEGFEIKKTLPTKITEAKSQDLELAGDIASISAVYIDGKKLSLSKDYSVKISGDISEITITSAKFESLSNGSHTITIEFIADDQSVNLAVQKFTVDIEEEEEEEEEEDNDDNPGGGGGGYRPDYDDDDDDKIVIIPPSTNLPNLNPTPTLPSVDVTLPPLPSIDLKKDVIKDSWYYYDVKWAYENNLMFSMSLSNFGIGEISTRGYIANVLAFHSKVDLTKYPSISARWFDSSMNWALEYKLFGTDIADGAVPLTRESMAVLVNNYLKYRGYLLPKPTQTSTFTDIATLTSEKQNAIKIATQLGILYGKSPTTMAPKDFLTIEELAAITRRIDTLLASKQVALK